MNSKNEENLTPRQDSELTVDQAQLAQGPQALVRKLKKDKKKKIELMLKEKYVDISNPDMSDAVIMCLQKTSKNQQEIDFLKRAIEGFLLKLDDKNKGQQHEANRDSEEKVEIRTILDNPQQFSVLLKGMNIEYVPKRQIIFNYGDEGNKYYIILKGIVWCMKPDSELQEEKMQKA